MIGDAPIDDDHVREFLKLEYTALRGELIKRVELNQRLLEITLASAAAILTISSTQGAEFSRVLLIYPILVMFLAFAWLHNDLRLRRLASYVKMQIEPAFQRQPNGSANCIGYESWLETHPYPHEGRIGGMSSIALFIIVQILVFLLGGEGAWTETGYQTVDAVLGVVGGAAIFATAGFLLFYRRLPGPNHWSATMGMRRRNRTHS
jgi:hypothetical protein